MTTRKLSGIRIGLNGLFLLAFLLRGLIPAGFMLDTSGGTGAMITICTGHGPLQIPAPGQDDHNTAHQHEAPCPFSVNAHFGFDGFHVPPQPQQIAYILAFLALTALILTPQRRFGNAAARAPPYFA